MGDFLGHIWMVSVLGALIAGDARRPWQSRLVVAVAFGPLGLAAVWRPPRVDPAASTAVADSVRTAPRSRLEP